MKTECRHSEHWTVTVTPDEGVAWPDTKTYESASYVMRPDRITFQVTRAGRTSVNISGLRLRKDGTPGSLRVHGTYWSNLPAWAAELVAKARSKHNLTQEALERPEQETA